MGRKKKQTPPVLRSDQDFLKAFSKSGESGSSPGKNESDLPVNRHGLPVMDDPSFETEPGTEKDQGDTEDFPVLLEESLNQKTLGKKTSPRPMPYKKRIKRYPPPETELDLHGFTALGAELKAKSFLITCKQQGYFTVRIIVGKGLHSDQGPVLPDVIEDLLNSLKKQDIILGFQWDRKKKARSGAVIVFIRQFSD